MTTQDVSDNRSFKDGRVSVICDDALQHPDFPHSAFITYWTITTYAAGAGKPNAGECRVKQATLAQRAGIPERTLREHLQRLTEAGFIYRVRTGRSSVLVVTGDRSLGRVPIGGQPAPQRSKSPRESGYDIADAMDDSGTNYRIEGLSDRDRHMVASAAGKVMEAGIDPDVVHDAVQEHMNQYPLLPTASDLLDIARVQAPASTALPPPSSISESGAIHGPATTTVNGTHSTTTPPAHSVRATWCRHHQSVPHGPDTAGCTRDDTADAA